MIPPITIAELHKRLGEIVEQGKGDKPLTLALHEGSNCVLGNLEYVIPSFLGMTVLSGTISVKECGGPEFFNTQDFK